MEASPIDMIYYTHYCICHNCHTTPSTFWAISTAHNLPMICSNLTTTTTTTPLYRPNRLLQMHRGLPSEPEEHHAAGIVAKCSKFLHQYNIHHRSKHLVDRRSHPDARLPTARSRVGCARVFPTFPTLPIRRPTGRRGIREGCCKSIHSTTAPSM